MYHIVPAEREDLPAILELQYLAYQREAELVGSRDIPPLKQTLEDLTEEYERGTVLVARNRTGGLVGSVRGYVKDGTLHIGKLMVLPAFQGQGIGTRLLTEIERVCPQPRYELFTSNKSVRNITLYERLGYMVFDRRAAAPELTFVYLEKRR